MKKTLTIEQAISWLKEHDLIAINRLEKKCGIPQRVLSKVLTGVDGRQLPDKYHALLIEELQKYGFNK